jgi:hypothetical protein
LPHLSPRCAILVLMQLRGQDTSGHWRKGRNRARRHDKLVGVPRQEHRSAPAAGSSAPKANSQAALAHQLSYRQLTREDAYTTPPLPSPSAIIFDCSSMIHTRTLPGSQGTVQEGRMVDILTNKRKVQKLTSRFHWPDRARSKILELCDGAPQSTVDCSAQTGTNTKKINSNGPDLDFMCFPRGG